MPRHAALQAICFYLSSCKLNSFFLCRRLQVYFWNVFKRSGLLLLALSLGLSPVVPFSHLRFFGRNGLCSLSHPRASYLIKLTLHHLVFFSLILKTSSVWSEVDKTFCSFRHGDIREITRIKRKSLILIRQKCSLLRNSMDST